MAFTKKNEEAVSPVIGVILMVAITVILAAVIAAFVFGMAGNIQKTKVVAVTGSRINSNTVSVTFQGGQDAASLVSICWTVNGNNVADWNPPTGSTSIPVGNTSTITAGLSSQVMGVGTFTDGTSQVIYSATL
jgi:flagellin-like protein